jgi:hypothetical protein
VANALARPAFQAALASPGFRAALQDLHFAWAMARMRGGCEEFGCGGNSPLVDGPKTNHGAFHELNLGGQPNTAGFAVVGIRMGSTPYAITVAGATVVARARKSNATALTGAALVGLVLDLRDLTGSRYTLHISGAGTTRYWAGAPDSVPTYSLTYVSATHAEPKPLCTAGINEAILFAGDRYDATTKTVTATGSATKGWVNIACAGTALAKLHLTRHTEAGQVVQTTAAERQAMLKMFTADVCGDGTSFTVHGQPLLWSDAKGVTRFAATPASREAVWNESGAVCLDTPRRPELAAAIAARCGARLPRCGPADLRGYVTSANP